MPPSETENCYMWALSFNSIKKYVSKRKSSILYKRCIKNALTRKIKTIISFVNGICMSKKAADTALYRSRDLLLHCQFSRLFTNRCYAHNSSIIHRTQSTCIPLTPLLSICPLSRCMPLGICLIITGGSFEIHDDDARIVISS